MKISKVSLYVREHSSRKYRKAKKRFYEPGTVFVLRYGSTWETVGEVSLADAERARLHRSVELLGGWRPQAKVKVAKPQPPQLLLDAAMDAYLSEIKGSRKKKTHQAYSVALKYFYESTGNKPIEEITRTDLVKFSVFLREEKEQSPRSCWNKFSNVMSFLKHHDITGKSLKIKAHDWPKFVEEEPEIYEQEMLDKFFAACDEEERLLFEFFQQTGMREQEGRRAGRPAAHHPQEAAGTHRRRGRTLGTSQEIEISTAPSLTSPFDGKCGFVIKDTEALRRPPDAVLSGKHSDQPRANDDAECCQAVEFAPAQNRLFF
jgi:hypothetical protein